MYGFTVAPLTFYGLSLLDGRPVADDAMVLVFTTLCFLWISVPLFTFASDDLLDPARLSLLPLRIRDVQVLQGVGGLLGVAPICTLIVVAGLVPATSGNAAGTAVALLAVPLQLALCVLSSRAAATGLSSLLRSRRGRDLGVALTTLLALSFQLVPALTNNRVAGGGIAQQVEAAAGPLRLFPPGLLASAPGRARDGQVLLALGQLLVVAGLVLVVLQLWAYALRRNEQRGDSSSGPARGATSLVPGWLQGLLPSGRLGAVAAKDLRYLTRDPRRLVQLATQVLVPVVAISLPLSSGSRSGLVFGVCAVGFFGGLLGNNRFGQDQTAVWMLIASSEGRTSARRDLLGGDLAIALVTVPILLVLGFGLGVVGGTEHLATAMGAGLALFFLSLGVSGLVAVAAPFGVPEGTNAFGSGNAGVGARVLVATFGSMLLVVLLALPLVPVLLSDLRGGSGLAMLLVGPVYGLALGAIGRELSARWWDRRGPEALWEIASAKS